ncbi:MAG: restriction endonuclease subunit S, partial [Dehalococcoidales bacterium]|nr:restriction endonuclease subunit S [Dehalococcoidales bacterium]
HPRTSWSSLSKFRAPVPPLPEQKAIAKVLSTVQKAIETQDKIIAAAKELKKSLMRHLFTYGPVPVSEAEKVPLRETAIGPMPEHWEVVKLGETTEKPEYGYTASATLENVGPKLLRITDIQDGRVMWTSVPYCQCSANDVQKYLLHPGDILFARIGATTGKTFMIIDFPQAIFASYLIRVRCKNLLLPGYLNQFTNTQMYWEQINASKGGRLKQGINIPVLTNLLIPLAPLQEQQEIARTLSLIDARIVSEEGRRSALQSLFKTMLHHLMTGKVRVKDMEATVS